jgi:hypothetical protein
MPTVAAAQQGTQELVVLALQSLAQVVRQEPALRYRVAPADLAPQQVLVQVAVAAQHVTVLHLLAPLVPYA